MRPNVTISLIIGILAVFLNFTAAAAPTNFVMLLECSPRMALRKEALTDITREIISSGVQDRMKRGQNLEVWFYDQTIQADAVKISWNPTNGAKFGNMATERIAAKRFDVPANLAIAFPSIRTLLKNSGELTVFIFTDGFQSIEGTPFDDQINSAMNASRDAFYKAKEPFLITLLGRDGEWIVGGVHSKLNSTIDIPEFPKPKAPEPPALASPPKYELPPSLLAISKKEKTNVPTLSQLKVAAASPTPPPPQPVVEPPPRKQPEPKAEPIVAKPAPVIEPKVETKVEPPKAVEQPAPQTIAKVSETNIVAASAPTPRTPTQPIQAVTTPAPPKFPWPILLAVFGLITAGGVFAYLKLKDTPPKSHGSLITEAYSASRDETLPRLPGSPGMRVKFNLPPTNPPVQKERPKRQE